MADEQIIYLGPEEELTNVRERLERIPTRHIILDVPLVTQLRSHVSWRLLYARARELNKEVLVISSDRQIRSVAKAVGFKVADSLESPPRRQPRPGQLPSRTSLGAKNSARLRNPPGRSLPNQQAETPHTQKTEEQAAEQFFNQSSMQQKVDERHSLEAHELYDPFAYMEGNQSTPLLEQQSPISIDEIADKVPDLADYPTSMDGIPIEDLDDIGNIVDFSPSPRNMPAADEEPDIQGPSRVHGIRLPIKRTSKALPSVPQQHIQDPSGVDEMRQGTNLMDKVLPQANDKKPEPQLKHIRIFISHSSKDNDFGMRLTKDLRHVLGDDTAVWYDVQGGLRGGDNWWDKIVEELTARNVFILILSPDAMESKWVNDETSIARRQRNSKTGKLIIPVLYRQCIVRDDLGILQIVSFLSPKEYEVAFNELLVALGLSGDVKTAKAASEINDPEAGLVHRMTPQIEAAFAEKDWLDVIRKTEFLIKKAPGAVSSSIYRMQGLALLEEGKVQQGQESLETALALVSERKQRLTLLRDHTDILISQDQWAKVLSYVKEALRLAPNDPYWLRMQQDAQFKLASTGHPASTVERIDQIAFSPPKLSLLPIVSSPFPHDLPPATSIYDQPTMDMSPRQDRNEQQIASQVTLPYTPQEFKHHNISLLVGTRTNPGIKRQHKPNEDSLFAVQGEHMHNSRLQQFGLFVVADGMGGHASGQDASRLAIQTIEARVLPHLSGNEALTNDALTQLLVDGVKEANLAVYQRNIEDRADMGTTMTAALIVGTTAHIANVGDSRTYFYHRPEGLKKITNDHSVVARLVEAGTIKPDDIYTHPKRNQIYRCLGEKPVIDVDSFTVHLQPGDKLLLCSDGLWDMVRDPIIEQILSTVPDPSQTGNALIKAALDSGGDDNVSVIVVHINEATQRTGLTGVQLLARPESPQYPPL